MLICKEIIKSIIEHGSINYEYMFIILGIYWLVSWKLNKLYKVITKLMDKIEENDDIHKKEIKHLEDKLQIKYNHIIENILDINCEITRQLDNKCLIMNNKIELKIKEVNKKYQDFELIISNKVSQKQLDDAFFMMDNKYIVPPKNSCKDLKKIIKKLPKVFSECNKELTKEKYEELMLLNYYHSNNNINTILSNMVKIWEIIDNNYDHHKEPNGYIGIRSNFKECLIFGFPTDARISKIRNNESFYYLYVSYSIQKCVNSNGKIIWNNKYYSIIFDFETYIGLGTFDKKTRVITFDKKYRKYMLGGYDHCF